MARKKRKASKKSKELSWEEMNDKVEFDDEVGYSIKGDFEVNSKISHPKFGVGFVQKIVDTTKIEVLFEDKSRTLIQNIA